MFRRWLIRELFCRVAVPRRHDVHLGLLTALSLVCSRRSAWFAHGAQLGLLCRCFTGAGSASGSVDGSVSGTIVGAFPGFMESASGSARSAGRASVGSTKSNGGSVMKQLLFAGRSPVQARSVASVEGDDSEADRPDSPAPVVGPLVRQGTCLGLALPCLSLLRLVFPCLVFPSAALRRPVFPCLALSCLAVAMRCLLSFVLCCWQRVWRLAVGCLNLFWIDVACGGGLQTRGVKCLR